MALFTLSKAQMPAPVSIMGAFFDAYDAARAEGGKDREEQRQADDHILRHDANLRAWQYQDIQRLYADQADKRFAWEREDRERTMRLTVAGEDLRMQQTQAAANDLATKIALQGLQLKAREAIRGRGMDIVGRWQAAVDSGDTASLAGIANDAAGLIDEVEGAWVGDPILKQGAALLGSMISGTEQGRAAIGALTAKRGLQKIQNFTASLPSDDAAEFSRIYGGAVKSLQSGVPVNVEAILGNFQERMKRAIPTYRDRATEARRAEEQRIEATTAVSAANQVLASGEASAEEKAAALRKKEEALMKLGERFEFGTVQEDGTWKGSGRFNGADGPLPAPASAPASTRQASPDNPILPPLDAVLGGGSWRDAPAITPTSPAQVTVSAPLPAGQSGPPAQQSVSVTIGPEAYAALGVALASRVHGAAAKAAMGDKAEAVKLLDEIGSRTSDMRIGDQARQQLNDLFQSLQRLTGRTTAQAQPGAPPPSPTDVMETLNAILRVK